MSQKRHLSCVHGTVPVIFSAEVYVVVCFTLRIQILCVQLGFLLLACFWKFDFPPMLVLVIAILNDGKNTLITAFPTDYC